MNDIRISSERQEHRSVSYPEGGLVSGPRHRVEGLLHRRGGEKEKNLHRPRRSSAGRQASIAIRVSIGDTPVAAYLKARYFSPRPLIEDDSVRSASSLIFNARAGYRFDNGVKLQLDVLNLFNAQTNQIEYYYLSRLPGEPIGGIADRHIHPAEPRAFRVTVAARFRRSASGNQLEAGSRRNHPPIRKACRPRAFCRRRV